MGVEQKGLHLAASAARDTLAPPASTGEKVSSAAHEQPAKKRHVIIAVSFFACVLAPALFAAAYLFTIAKDQFHSSASFSIRMEENANPLDIFGAFTDVSSGTTPDSHILHHYIQSQALVESMDEDLDLKSKFNRHQDDFVFALNENASIEDLVDYWQSMLKISTDTGPAIVSIEARAFTPQDAQQIAAAIIAESATLINDLNLTALQDAMKFAGEDLEAAQDRLKAVRQDLRDFRLNNQIINPGADAESQMGVVSELQARLAQLLVRQGSLLEYAGEDDSRTETVRREIRAIRNQIAQERAMVAGENETGLSLPSTIARYEELLVDLRFSEDAYVAALAAAESARAEARRKSRYLAVHIEPTLAEESLYPDRPVLLLLITLALVAAWSTVILIYYNVRERS